MKAESPENHNIEGVVPKADMKSHKNHTDPVHRDNYRVEALVVSASSQAVIT